MAKYYYNGVLLPEIPVLDGYPYCCIRKNNSTGYYDLLYSPTGFYYKSSGVYDKDSVKNHKYTIAIDSDMDTAEWEDQNNTTYSGWTIDSSRILMWSNHDIPNDSATSTDIYFAALPSLPDSYSTNLVLSIEAETGTLSGSASIADRASYSGNVVVDGITSSNGSVTLDFTVDKEGFYLIDMLFTHSGTRGFKYTLNGKTYTHSVVGTSYYAIEHYQFTVYLYAGTNTVKFSGYSKSYAPMFDRFDIYQYLDKQIEYVTNGYAELSTTDIRAISAVKASYITWNANVPEGTAVNVYSRLSDGEYVICENGGSIAGISAGDDLSGETLYAKVEMTTEDPTVTPILTGIHIQVYDETDVYAIVLRFDPGNVNSIQCAVGDITVKYDGSGTLMGIGGPVADFEFKFTPEGLEHKFHPHDPEHIEVDVDINATLTRIYHTDFPNADHIETTITPVANLIHIEDI